MLAVCSRVGFATPLVYMETLRFLSAGEVDTVRQRFGSPVYVYDEATLRRQAAAALAFPNAFGLTVRYAMKAWSNAAVLKLYTSLGLHIDASSGYEVRRAIRAGMPAARICLSSQELPPDLPDLLDLGIQYNACSLHQLAAFGRARPGGQVGVRFNPGAGSGANNRTNTGGPASSFGIWHEQRGAVAALAAEHGLSVVRIHTHIGSGSDPAVWQQASGLTLALVRAFPTVTTVNLGGGYKVARMSTDKGTDLAVVGVPVREAFVAFAAETGRQLHLEIEPGTFLVANAGALVATIQDVVATGPAGYTFLKLDAGMTEILRPSLYGAQHPLIVVPSSPRAGSVPTIVVGHCCESGDLLTPAPGDSEALAPRDLAPAVIGDALVIEGAGAYCAAMPSKNYNSFPEVPEVWRRAAGDFVLIRRRQTLDQVLENEVG